MLDDHGPRNNRLIRNARSGSYGNARPVPPARQTAIMPDMPHFKAAQSPQNGNDTRSLVAGKATLETLLQIPAQAKSAFDSLRALSTHLADNFGARLAFVSCRDTSAQSGPQYLFDTARSAFAAERARLFALELPLDVAIAMTGRPLLWRPASEIAAMMEKREQATSSLEPVRAGELVAVPYQCGPLLAICAVQTARGTDWEGNTAEAVAWHCVQYMPEHFRHHPLPHRARASVLSPQEERIILKCAAGLTDKEIGRELDLSPHTVRTHINSAKAKLGARNKTHAVMLFRELTARN